MKKITIEKRKGSFYKLKSGNYRLTYMFQGKSYRETFEDIETYRYISSKNRKSSETLIFLNFRTLLKYSMAPYPVRF